VAKHLGRPPDERLKVACQIVQEKAQTLAEVWPLVRFLFEMPDNDEKAWRKVMKEDALKHLVAAREALAASDEFDAAAVEEALSPLPDRFEVGAGRIYQPIRVAITGGSVSPGIFESVAALGRQESLARIDDAVGRLQP